MRLFMAAALLSTMITPSSAGEDAAEPAAADGAEADGQCACGNLGREKGEEKGDGGGSSSAKAAAAEGGESGVARTPAAAKHNEETVNIPGGRFYMGTPKHLVHFPQDGEGPVRQVKMTSFAIDKYLLRGIDTQSEPIKSPLTVDLWMT